MTVAGFGFLSASDVSSAWAQGIGKKGSSKKGSVTFAGKFWDYLTNSKSAYKNWQFFPGTQKLKEGQSPHGAFVTVYVNSIASKNPKDPPQGSILVKENYGKDKKTLMAITVMYRSKGYDAKNHDWYWVKYLPNGSVARTPKEKGSKLIAGKFASCINCHSQSEGNDLVYLNDE